MTTTTTEKPMNKAELIDELVRRGKLKNKTAGKALLVPTLRKMLDGDLIDNSMIGKGTAAEEYRTERQKTFDAAHSVADTEPAPPEPVTQEMVERDQYAEIEERRGLSSLQEDRRGVRDMQARRRMKNRVKHRRRIARLRSSGMIRG